MTLGRHSGFRQVPGETGTTCKKAVFILLFPREIQEIKWYHYLVGKPTHPFNALCVIYPHVEVAFKDKFAHGMGQKDPNE